MNFVFKKIGASKPIYCSTEAEVAIVAGEQLDAEISIEHLPMITNSTSRTAQQEAVFKKNDVIIARATAETHSSIEFVQAIQRGSLWTP